MKWQDITTYSRDDKERKPTSFACRGPNLGIVVTCGHRDYPGQWVMHCSRLGIDTFLLEAKDLKSAKEEAVKVASSKIALYADDLCEIDVANRCE